MPGLGEASPRSECQRKHCYCTSGALMIESSMIPTLGGAEHNQLPLMLSGKPAAVFQRYLNALSAPELMYCIYLSVCLHVWFFMSIRWKETKRGTELREEWETVCKEPRKSCFFLNYKF